MFSKGQKVLCGLIFLAVLPSFPALAFRAHVDDDLRIELPAGGQLRVRNDFGNVSAEVWNNSYVSVSATIDSGGATRFSRSPIVIDNRGSRLTISVVRRPLDPVAAIHLSLKIPDSSRFEASTTRGDISLLRMPSSATLRSASGALQVAFPLAANADITARSLHGTIRSDLNPKPAVMGQLFQARIGDGSRKLEAQTDTGEILITYAPGTIAIGESRLREPELIGNETEKPAAGTPAGQAEGVEISEGDIIRVDSQLVTLNVSVVDRGTSRGLVGLGQSDFKLFEDGQEQRILQFESSAAPFDLVLLIDLSGSTREVIKLIRAAAIRFIDAARPADRIAVITFAGEASVVSGLTVDRELLRQRTNAIDTARGDTKLYDAIDFAINEVTKERKKSRRTAIVLMSDGLDGTIPGVSGQQGSQHSYQETLRNVQEFDGVLYTLWLNTEYEAMNPLDTQPEAFDAGHDRMKEMADAGGGMFYPVERLTDLAGTYEQVVADLGTLYSLVYRPSNNKRDGQWRAIRIAISRSNAVARGKRGYYAN